MNLSTPYLGLRLKHPFVAGASPLSARVDSAKRLEDAGAAALVLHSLFEEQITLATTGRIHHMDPLDGAFAKALAWFPPPRDYPFAPHEHLEHLRQVKQALTIPVIASLNGTSAEAWLKFARLLQDAGADALELNFYEVVTDAAIPGLAVEHQLVDAVTELKRELRIPLAVKLSPFFTAFANLARQLDEAGADGLVLFNRFYQPDIDIRRITAEPCLELSRSSELLLRLRWAAILHGRLRASLAITGGVVTPADGVKALLAGAHAVQIVSAVLRHGPGFFASALDGLTNWMNWHHIDSVEDFRGCVCPQTAGHLAAFERANYIRTLHSWGM
jgi:dihydroorotate dehydrogenase (fumarate)